MKAITHKKYGPPSVLALEEVDKPTPKDDEVLIQVAYSTINRTDTGLRSAEYFISRFFTGLLKPKFLVQGNEFAGKVTAVGSNVSNFKVGDRVFGFNDETLGAHAEFMITPADKMIAKIPKNISYKDAAALTEGSHYALNYITASKLKSGDSVMLNGASGSIGSAALQILSAMNIDVTATCSSKNIKLIESLGAKKVINYEEKDFTKTDDRFNAVFDAVGKSQFKKCKPLLIDGGIYMSSELGPYGQNPFLALVHAIRKKFPGQQSKKRVLFPIPKNTNDHVLYVRDLTANGKYKAVIDKEVSMEQIIEATEYVESGQKTGNVLLKIAPEIK